MPRFSKRSIEALREVVQYVKSQPKGRATDPKAKATGQRPLAIAKLSEHLVAPTAFGGTGNYETAEAELFRLTLDDDREPEQYEVDDGFDEAEPITVFNWFPWVWEYAEAILVVERLHGVWVPRLPLNSIVLGKTAGAHGKGDPGTVNIYAGPGDDAGSEQIATGYTLLNVYNRYADLGSGKWVECQWRLNGWKLINGEC